ncbi:MAG TPA: TolC family protein [Bacteroidales bacterium]|nr:TolC family protein [Bacteroidales bacterium]
MMKRIFILIIACLIASAGSLTAQKVWSLEDCIQHAIDHNIQIKQQTIQTRVQKNTLDQSKLGLLPSVSGQASHDYSFGRALDQTTYDFYNQTLQSNYFYLGGRTDLFTGLQNLNTIQKNKYELLAGEQDLQRIRDNVSLSVALAYLQILLNKELVTATESQLNTTLEQIAKTRKMVDAGSVAMGNLLQIEAQAAQEEVTLVNMQNQLETSYLNLTQLLELETPAGFEIIVPDIRVGETADIAGNIDEIYSVAVQSRPEILGSELRLTASEYALKVAKGARSPSVSMSHNFGTRYSHIADLPGQQSFDDQLKNNKNFGLGFSLNIPILNGWQVNKNILNSKLAVENSQYTLEGTRKELYKDIQQAYADAVAALKKYYASAKAVESSEESFRYTEQKFDVGMITPVDYNAAKTQLLNSQSEMSQAKYEYIFKTKVLDFYKGLPLTLNQ